MNKAQRQVVWSGAAIAAVLGLAAAQELSRADKCTDQLVRWVDGGGRATTSKIRNCR